MYCHLLGWHEYIVVYTSTNVYKTFWKNMHDYRIQTNDLMQSVLPLLQLCYKCWYYWLVLRGMIPWSWALLQSITWRLVMDVRRWPRRAPSAGHDIAGLDLHLDLLKALVSYKVAQDCRPIEKQAAAAAGQWACWSAVLTQKAGPSTASEYIFGRAHNWDWDSSANSRIAMIEWYRSSCHAI
jgi:hypothetical protein